MGIYSRGLIIVILVLRSARFSNLLWTMLVLWLERLRENYYSF